MRSTNRRQEQKAFTLIELLIVVAIIAILAAIAVPNFLEAQMRSKVAREKNDLRTQSVAMEAFMVDNNKYTRDSDSSLDTIGQVKGKAYEAYANGIVQLTTPIAYITNILSDPFAQVPKGVGAGAGAMGYRIASGSWSYGSGGFADDQSSALVFAVMGPRKAYCLIGVGPDGNRCRVGYKCFPFQGLVPGVEGPSASNGGQDMIGKYGQPGGYTEYDPTNGSKSVGDVYRFGGDYTSGRFMLNGATIGLAESPCPGAW